MTDESYMAIRHVSFSRLRKNMDRGKNTSGIRLRVSAAGALIDGPCLFGTSQTKKSFSLTGHFFSPLQHIYHMMKNEMSFFLVFFNLSFSSSRECVTRSSLLFSLGTVADTLDT